MRRRSELIRRCLRLCRAGCITCHRWGDRPSLGIQGPDLSNLAARLQEGWLREYLVNPAAYRPGTLMPSFWPGGKSFNPAILGGDTDKQIAWSGTEQGSGTWQGEIDRPALTFKQTREYWRDAVYATAKPVLYVVTPRLQGQADNLQRKRPATRTEVFENAGHALFVDEPQRFNTLMDEFLVENLR